ncbi:Prophage PssSM-02, Orf45 [Pseudomonas syringae pv. pisi]|nr:Prophage PssSM-02, Orf45 [Pseudomonas syringae pv. pisi]
MNIRIVIDPPGAQSRRYGASPDVQLLVEAANKPAEVGKLNISRAWLTCLLKSA